MQQHRWAALVGCSSPPLQGLQAGTDAKLGLGPRRYKSGDRPPQPQRTFQNTWRARCEDDWLAAFYMFSASEPSRLPSDQYM